MLFITSTMEEHYKELPEAQRVTIDKILAASNLEIDPLLLNTQKESIHRGTQYHLNNDNKQIKTIDICDMFCIQRYFSYMVRDVTILFDDSALNYV